MNARFEENPQYPNHVFDRVRRCWIPKEDLPRPGKAALEFAKGDSDGPKEANWHCEDDAEIACLAKLPLAAYERERKVAAGRLGVRVSTLDKQVSAARPADESVPGQGRQLAPQEPEPWPEQVDGAKLTSELEAAIRRYVVISAADALACALWVLHTYCFDAFTWTPRLAITAPEKRCGKTTLLRVIGELVPRALRTENITAAVLFRTVELARPVLLTDEADSLLPGNEELRGILNSGYLAGGQVTSRACSRRIARLPLRRLASCRGRLRIVASRSPCGVASPVKKVPGFASARRQSLASWRERPRALLPRTQGP
jgi:hypothetical protein